MKVQPKKIAHFVAKTTQSISSVLSEHLNQPKDNQDLLFSLGAIYKNKQRVLADESLEPQDHLQVYLRPRRYAINMINWKKIVVSDTEQFLVVNKPQGIPIHSTDDNLVENVLFQLRRHLGKELWTTHRLDSSVSGLVVLAKTEKFQAEFNQLVAQRKVRKFYRALVEHKPPMGVIRHYMSPEEKIPRKLSEEAKPDWLECLLEVRNISPWLSREGQSFWEVDIELYTGRTHQVRAQLSWAGSPVLGDKTYRGRNRAGFTKEGIALQAYRLEWKDLAGIHGYVLPTSFQKNT